MIGNWNTEWLNLNSQRAYPLTAWATQTDITGALTIPQDFLLGLYFPITVNFDVYPDYFYIQQLGIFPTGYSITLGYDAGDTQILVASASIAAASHTEYNTYVLAGTGAYAAYIGRVTIGTLNSIKQLAPGIYNFDRTGGQLEVDCIRPMPTTINSIVVTNGQDSTAPMFGNIEIIAGTNMRITTTQINDNNFTITLNAISGEGLSSTCVCANNGASGSPIKFINGIPPLPDGNFRMVGDSCINIAPITSGLQFTDKCSSPCCGSTEQAALVAQIDRFATGAVTLQNAVANLTGQVTQMSATILGSKLADTGCVSS